MRLPAPPANDYTPLAGAPRGGAGAGQRLYLGPNHVLILRLYGTTEEAHRFYYKDITALRCQKTRKHLVQSALYLALLLGPWLVLGRMPGVLEPQLYIAATFSVFGAVLLFANLFRGPTCRTWLHTANHTEPLPGLGRYRAARKALRALHERVEAVQGPAAGTPGTEAMPPFVPIGAGAVAEPGPMPDRFATLAFGLSILLAASYVLDFQMNLMWKNGIDTIVCDFMTIATPFLLYRLRRANGPAAARWAAGSLVALFALTILIETSMGTILGIADPDHFVENIEWMDGHDGIASLWPDNPVLFRLLTIRHIFYILLFAGCGFAGLLSMARRPSGTAARAA